MKMESSTLVSALIKGVFRYFKVDRRIYLSLSVCFLYSLHGYWHFVHLILKFRVELCYPSKTAPVSPANVKCFQEVSQIFFFTFLGSQKTCQQ